MVVHSADGGKLGKIVSCLPEGFIVEKGLFLPKASQFRYDDVADVRDGEVFLLHAREVLADETWWKARTEEAPRPTAVNRAQVAPPVKPAIPQPPAPKQVAPAKAADESATARLQNLNDVRLYEEELSAKKRVRDAGEVRLHKRVVTTQKQITVPVMHEEITVERIPHAHKPEAPIQAAAPAVEEVRVPLCEEEITAEKHTRGLGDVRLHKRVVTTKKQITVPVMHEEITVERVPYDRKPAKLGDGMFVESTQVIPLHDEEVEIHKYPVVREEVHVRKTALQEERTATAELRREELEIDRPKVAQAPWTGSREPHEFTEGTEVIPLHEEEVEIRKYPVLREEVRIKKAALQEQRTATADTLKEELDVEQPKAIKDRYRRTA